MPSSTETTYANGTDLPDRLAGAVCMQVVSECKDAVAACVRRNEDFDTYDLQVRRDPYWAGVTERYEGGSTYEDPTITFLQFFDQLASQEQITHREQIVSYNATHPRDTVAAATLEAYCNNLIVQADMADDFYDLRHLAFRHSYVWYKAVWEERYKTTTREEIVHKASGHVIPEDALPDDAEDGEYELSTQEDEELEHEGLVFTVHEARDIYLWPPESQSAKKAVRVYQRMGDGLTEHDLQRGVNDYDWDQDAINQICQGSPVVATAGSDDEEKTRTDGIEPLTPGLYECFEAIGYPPLRLNADEAPSTKKLDPNKQYRWLFEAASGIVFSFTEYKSKTRGYVKFGCFDDPGRLRGESIPSIVAMQQIEASHSGRMQMDSLDMDFDPDEWIPATMFNQLESYRRFPGNRRPYNTNMGFNPSMAPPVQRTPNNAAAAMQARIELRNGAGMIFSSHARGQVQSNQITATEQAASGAGADAKSNLLFHSFRRGLKELFAEVVPIILKENVRDNQEFYAGGKMSILEPAMLEKRFTISILGDSESANPQLRLQKAIETYKWALQSPSLQEAVKRGDRSGMFAVEGEVWRAFGFRDLKSVMGKEPGPPPDPNHVLQLILAAVQQYAMKGDPNMQSLMQQIMQMMKSQAQPDQQGQQPQQGMVPQGQPVPFGPPSMNGNGAPPMMMAGGGM